MNSCLGIVTIVAVTLLIGCKEVVKEVRSTKENKEVAQDDTFHVPSSWIVKRVENTKIKLNDSDAGTVVWKAMEAHGGLENWYGNGSLSF